MAGEITQSSANLILGKTNTTPSKPEPQIFDFAFFFKKRQFKYIGLTYLVIDGEIIQILIIISFQKWK